ncbi:hypothetical protein PYCCODRAFT_1418180 [Trametes coccinea BRFM310]|uniref:Uncharacterized protein n=1 Tax=Trametes coccinea (strain BRFM310) TaxID=1353009 RepID=A0A1Y2IAK6_TRAC3|nr:hypothetical protein PYCCODRAFT_1418180 [Trametes coccinea BRFM310]
MPKTKAKATRQPKAPPRQPYDDGKRTRKPRSQPKPSTGGSSQAVSTSVYQAPSPCFPIALPTSATGAVLYRDFCIEHVKTCYPGVEPRNDFELLWMAESTFKGTVEELRATMEEAHKHLVKECGVEESKRMVAKMLGQHIEPTGFKPRPKDTNKYIHIRPIPDTKYSIRLFPGSLSAAEYCLDFVDSASGEPVNSPFEFELWGIPDPDTPWLGVPISMELSSMERSHGIKQEDILPGHEKFLLRDGQTCVLIRPGKPRVRFTVPVRRHPDTVQVAPEVEVVLDFPKVIA